jgi:hypothetical protein
LAYPLGVFFGGGDMRKLRTLLGLLAGTGALSVPISWLFKDYVPTFVFDRLLGVLALEISSETGISEARLESVTQDIALPIILSGLITWMIYRFSMWSHSGPARTPDAMTRAPIPYPIHVELPPAPNPDANRNLYPRCASLLAKRGNIFRRRESTEFTATTAFII